MSIWDAKSDQARGLLGQTVADSLQVSIEVEDSLVHVWEIISSLFDKSDDVSVYNFERRSLTLNLLTLKELSYIFLN